MKRPLYHHIASRLGAMKNCARTGNDEWYKKHRDAICYLIDNYLPHGSGIDGRNTIDWGESHGERIVLGVSFHHMNETGSYDGWTDHTITVRPSLVFNFELSISGCDRNQIKEHLGDLFDAALREEIDVQVARDAHAAEQELAALRRAQELQRLERYSDIDKRWRDTRAYGEWCRKPAACAGKGYCPLDPTCGD